MRMPRALTLVLALALAGPAAAAEWQVLSERSSIRFEYILDGEPAEGSFRRFSGEGQLDAERPGEAALELRIEAGSIDLGNALVSAYATSLEWFDAKEHPQVVYRLTELEREAGDRFAATGRIVLKGRTERLVTPFRVETGARTARARGRLTVDRRAFGLGTELTDLFVEIGAEVVVRFDLHARRID